MRFIRALMYLLHWLGFHFWRYGPMHPHQWSRACIVCHRGQTFVPDTSWFSGGGWWV